MSHDSDPGQRLVFRLKAVKSGTSCKVPSNEQEGVASREGDLGECFPDSLSGTAMPQRTRARSGLELTKS